MKSIIVDFSKIYIGTIAKQGEHNRAQLVFALPDDFAGADYVNAEFKKSDNSDVVIEGFIPKDGFVTIPLTQGLTNVCDQIDIQLVAYAVDGAEITEIAKSLTVRGVIRPSLNILFNHDEPGIIERVIAFINAWGTEKLPEMWNEKHDHKNKTLLDSITPEMLDGEQADWNENDAAGKSFVKNRTHWSESSVVLNDYTVEWLTETPPYSPQNWNCVDLDIPLEEDVEYTLIADGQTITGIPTKIELDVGYIQKHLVIGNLSYLNGLMPSGETYEDNGFPMLLDFATEYTEVQNTFNLILTNEDYFGNNLAFSVGKEEMTFHPLETNYLPESAKDAIEMKHTHTNKTVLDDFSESNGILQYDGHAVPQFPINDVKPTTLSNDYTVPWLKPNVWHRFGSADSPVRSISILELQAVDNSVAEEYLVEFWTGATAPSPVIFPLDVRWPDGSEPLWKAEKHYQVSIVNNVGLWCESEEVNE